MAELPQNSRALYRICTKKSVIGFGKYADLTVGDVLKIDKQYIVYRTSQFWKSWKCQQSRSLARARMR